MTKLIIDRIEQLCIETIEHFNLYSDTNPYLMGKCITAEQILEIIKELRT